MMNGLRGLVWLGCILWCAAAIARDFDVDDSRTLAESLKQVQPGDHVVLRDGVWRDVDLIFDAGGKTDAPITFRAFSPGGVTIAGHSRIRIAGANVVVSGIRFTDAWHEDALVQFRRDSKRAAEHCSLVDCQIVDCNPPDPKQETKYVSIYGSSNAMTHCHMSGKVNRGATLVVWLAEGWGGHRIANNYFGVRPELGRNGGETIRVGDSATAELSAKTIVEGNWFDRCDGETEAISNKSCDNVYRGNLFTRCSGTLTLRHGHRCLVTENIFMGEKARGSGGVRIIGRDHVVTNNHFESLEGDRYRSGVCVMNGITDSPVNGYDPVQRATIRDNTFVECKRSIHFGGDNDEKSQVGPVKCEVNGNTIVSRRGPMIEVTNARSLDDASGNRFEGNRCFGDGDVGIDIAKVDQRPEVVSVQARVDWIRSNAGPRTPMSLNAQPKTPASP